MNVNTNNNFPKNVSHIYDGDRFEDLEIENSEDVLLGIDDILENYEIEIVNPLRSDKKLLVLDVDYTLTCYDGTPRDFLDEMLKIIYENYDIVLWSAMTREFAENRIKSLKLRGNPNYKIAFCLERDAMVPVFSWKFDDYVYVKALELIWKKFPRYSVKNTIIFDDNWRNYALNKTAGLSTTRHREVSCSNVRSELMRVAEYLTLISKLINLDIFDHNHWMSNQVMISKQNIKSFERATTLEDEVTMSALSPDPHITLHLLSSTPIPELPYHGGERQTGRRISKTLTFIEKDKSKNEISLLDLVTPEVYTAEMAKKTATWDIEVLNPLRDGKKLLILDLGYTLCDPDVPSFPSVKARRPHLSQLLTRAYRHYDIVIWSDMTREDSSEALREMGIIDDENYKIAFHLTVQEMMIVTTSQSGSVHLKPLEFVWGKFPRFSPRNTVIIDDNKWYFALNHQSGCEVMPYKARNEQLDVELEFLASYLEWIAFFENFQNLNHRHWRCPKNVLIANNKRIVDQRRRVDIEWHLNKLKFVNVPGDVTVGELKYFIHDTVGVAVACQVLLFNVPVGYKYEGGRVLERDVGGSEARGWKKLLEKNPWNGMGYGEAGGKALPRD
ncbi:uncharacterized protein LOC107035542 [Diachasma alloeum]|uniref:uncharacterized protein LOC107035542 n=1 Tax=Diachasma alloeum TaxID=454923 RepID=UPI000738278C|nr:uncharacterized protein LOC107035542 [Diachasma alloeum]